MINKRELITFRIIPDRTVTNRRNHDFMRSIHDFHEGFRKRINLKNKELNEPSRFFWDILMTSNDVAFYCTVPKERESFVRQQLELIWDRATITEETVEREASTSDIDVCEMSLTRHNIFSLKVDKRIEHEPLGSILMGTKELKEDDFAHIQIMCQPVNRLSWQDSADKAHKNFRAGKVPKRMKISKKDALLASGDAFLFVMDQAAGALDIAMDALAGKASEKDKEIRDKLRRSDSDLEKRTILIDGELKTSTQRKRKDPTFKTWIRILAGSSDPGRRASLLSSLSNGFHDLHADNELERVELSKSSQERIAQEIINFAPSSRTLLDPNVMILSNNELGRLIELPSAKLQDDFNFQSVQRREVKIPDALKKGIPWGVLSLKGLQEVVHLPTANWGLLCRPQVILGKMGTGKTMLGSRLGHLFPEHGFTAIMMDTADGGLIDDAINALPEDFPESHIIDLDFGNLMQMPPSDWNEMTSSMKLKGEDWSEVEVNRRKASNKLTSVLIDFIDKLATYETTDRMERYLSAVAKAILTSPDRGLMEVVLCLTSDEYRENVLKSFKITDPIVFGTIQELHEMSTDSRNQIVKDIMSRINVLLSNDYMRNSLLQSPKLGGDGKPLINVRKWIDGNLITNPKYGGAYFVGIRIPKSELFETATDRLATFWDAKIWLSALSRYDLPKKNGCHGKPFVYIRDEPHQTPSAFNVHDDACREARKWGMKNVWMAHKLEDFDFMKKTLKDAGAQYTLFSTSKETVKSLKEELAPFEEEELQKIPEQFYCVSKFAESDQAFLCATMKTPFIKDRSYIREKCSKLYGKPLKDIEREIFNKTKVLFQKEKPKPKARNK
ncbi:hypothetical protein [Psychrobacillus sp. FJAT-21963]|uniref:hypothetical protein n=1 Tax=Psychrobacillus sp. FJAT-21963 TaxID=1712028 RepID=UPI0006F5BB09|nr:hypothetical protein [Psychrobacillus sp. FJAT-21963]KQL37107.1 hypothetical protein AN959_03425 [Psychrobacillus sp. FJAT-21963]